MLNFFHQRSHIPNFKFMRFAVVSVFLSSHESQSDWYFTCIYTFCVSWFTKSHIFKSNRFNQQTNPEQTEQPSGVEILTVRPANNKNARVRTTPTERPSLNSAVINQPLPIIISNVEFVISETRYPDKRKPFSSVSSFPARAAYIRRVSKLALLCIASRWQVFDIGIRNGVAIDTRTVDMRQSITCCSHLYSCQQD